LAFLGLTDVNAQRKPETPNLSQLADGKSWKVVHADAETLESGGKQGVRLTARGDSANGIVGLAYPIDLKFSTGTIDVDLKGQNVRGRSFLGIAFNVVDERNFE